MGFYEENKNFIIQRFYTEMKGMDVSEKTESYKKNLKAETRKRLINSYNNCNNSKVFFIECIEILQQYDFPFLFINLFFEENFEEIIVSIDFSRFYVLNQNSNDILINRISKYINNLKSVKNFRTEDFLKCEFEDIVGIDDKVWKNKSTWPNNEFLKIYAEWIVNNLNESENDEVIYTAIIFNKIWIEDIGFIGDHKNSKAIIFLHILIKSFEIEIQKNNFINISSFYDKLKIILDDIFVSGYFSTPLTDNYSEGFYSTGYYEKLKVFKEKILFSKNIHQSYTNCTYLDLFEKINEYEIDAISLQNIVSKIHLKLDNLIFPTKNELNSILNINGDNSFERIKIDFLKRQYLFEII